jgi:uncharacterized protein Yka (UPF0111/DUF47 family)
MFMKPVSLKRIMTEKQVIIRELGEEGLLLPALVNNSLLANDRIKYYFTLLQTAAEHADHPDRKYASLRTERETAGVDLRELDSVTAEARVLADGEYVIPLLSQIVRAMETCTDEMIAPFRTGQEDRGSSFAERKTALFGSVPVTADGRISRDGIRLFVSGDRSRGDSLHILVMDMHRGLNELQASLARVTLDGALTYMLRPEDEALVRSFMAGLNRTAPLKFDHPGLGTTATRAGDTLLIQNDIGETDAHVLVIKIRAGTVSIIYTDIHMQRVAFFQSLFDSRNVQWEDTLSRRGSSGFEKSLYHLSVGTFATPDGTDPAEFLEFLGSRIVFLIDWNRARKQLRNFLPNRDSIAVLKWAADNDFGHIGFLRLGGEAMVYSALELAARVPLRYGEPLHQLLGRERTAAYLRWVLRTATSGLLHNQSSLLLQDEIKTELLRNFRSAHEGMMDICVEHASLLIEVGTGIRDSFFHIQQDGNGDFLERNAKRSKQWESRADQLVMQLRILSRRIENAEFFFSLIHTADDALDYLEEASFFTTILSTVSRSEETERQLAEMADIATRSSQEYLKVLVSAQSLHKGYGQDEMQDFLEAVNRVIGLEHDCDVALRECEKTIFTKSRGFRELEMYRELARLIEESTNSLMKAVYIMHDHIIGELNR